MFDVPVIVIQLLSSHVRSLLQKEHNKTSTQNETIRHYDCIQLQHLDNN